jgi:crotonobetainyl-CoA:carnitine CoA-transferase CaiB-like acyl-CoA transferase
MIGLLEPKFWRTFCLAVDRPELVGAETSDAINYGDDEKLAEELAAIFVGRDRKEWVSFAVEHQLPIAPVLSPQDLLDDEHMQAQEMLVESSHPGTGRPISLVGLPIRVAGQHFEIERLAPAFGADTNGVK